MHCSSCSEKQKHQQNKKQVLHVCVFTAFLCVTLLQHTVLTVPGSHHVHLNNPENVAPIVSDFLRSTVLSQSAEPQEPMSKL